METPAFKALPEPALPQLHPWGVMGPRARSKPQSHVCVTGRQEENLSWDSHSCPFISQGSFSHMHRNVPKSFQNPFCQPHTNLLHPFIPSHSHVAFSLSTTGSWHHHSLASQASPSCLSFPSSSEAKELHQQGHCSLTPDTASQALRVSSGFARSSPCVLVQTLTAQRVVQEPAA